MKEYKNKEGKIVGVLEGRVYITYRRPEHFMRKFRGFGISETIIKDLELNGCETIKICYSGKNNITYTSNINTWLKSSLTHNFENEDLQIFVSVEGLSIKPKIYWKEEKDETKEPEKQLNLFNDI